MTWITGKRASSILYSYLLQMPKNILFFVPSNVCPIVLATFHKANVQYELLDICEDSLCIDKQLLEERLKQTELAGLLYVRTFGYLENVKDWFSNLKDKFKNIKIIDDRCLCIPSLEDSEVYDNVDLTLFSTGYAKFVELNFGGFACANKLIDSSHYSVSTIYDDSDHQKMVSTFNDCIKNNKRFKYIDCDWLETGEIDDMDMYFSTIEREKKKSFAQKEIINRIYKENIPKSIWLGEKFNSWRFSLLVNRKELLLKNIFNEGYFASSHYASLSGIFTDSEAPVSKKIYSKIVNLFNDHRVTEEDALAIAKIVREHEAKYG